jgi:hypothetical protein
MLNPKVHLLLIAFPLLLSGLLLGQDGAQAMVSFRNDRYIFDEIIYRCPGNVGNLRAETVSFTLK